MSVAMPPEDVPELDDAIRAVVTRLSRPHPSGGAVIERAAIMAEGTGSTAIIRWIIDHAGEPEATVPEPAARGLYGARRTERAEAERRTPRRYVLPAGALS